MTRFVCFQKITLQKKAPEKGDATLFYHPFLSCDFDFTQTGSGQSLNDSSMIVENFAVPATY
jgi:hypothetical protein